jgi:multiple sugar transport system substrate-binding protein
MAPRDPRPADPRRRASMRFAALVIAALLLAACDEPADRTVVRFWAMGREAEVVGGFIDEFEREHPDIDVVVQQVPWTAAHEKLLTAFAADALPDVFQLGNTWLAEFATLGALAPLDARLAASTGIDRSDYFEGIWDTNVVDGVTLGVPWYVDTRLLFVRSDLLAAAGFDAPPTTWAEWERQLAALRRRGAPDDYAVLIPLNEFEQLLSFALQQPEGLLDADGRHGRFQDAGFRRALAFYAGIFARDWAPPMSETQISNVWDEFFKGRFAFYISGPWNIREFRRRVPPGLESAWTTAPLPGPDGPGAGIAGGTSLVISARSPRSAQAWALIEFLSRPAVQQRFHAEIGNLPPRRSTWALPALTADPLARAFRDQLERVRPTPKVLEWERIVQEMRLASERVVRGGVSQDVAARELDAKVDAILAKRRWVLDRRRAEATR